MHRGESPETVVRGARRRRQERGIALVIVLWVITLLTIIAMGLTTTQRTETALIGNQVDTVRFRALADAALAYTVLNLTTSPPLDLAAESEPWVPDGQPHTWRFAGEALEIRVFNERSRIDLNQASREQLEALLLLLAVAPDEAAALADAILDWRDPDDLTQLNGAEDDDYFAAGLPYGAKDGPFDTVAELRQVMGMTADLYRAMAPALTIDSGATRVDARYASALVLAVEQGLTLEEAEEVVEERLEPVVPGAETRAPINRGGPLYRIQVTWLVGERPTRTMQALLSTYRRQATSYTIRWRRFGLSNDLYN